MNMDKDNLHSEISFNNPWPLNYVVRRQALTGYEVENKNYDFELQWLLADSSKNYDPTKTNYPKDSVSYKLSIQGWRCDNFNNIDFVNKQSIIYLGCSHGFGIGVPEDEIWTSQVHDLIEKKFDTEYNFINLCIPGGSTDEWLRFLPYIKKFNPKMICANIPNHDRMFIIDDENGTPLNMCPTNVEENVVYKYMLLYANEYRLYKEQMTLNAVNTLCEALDIKFYHKRFGEPTYIDDDFYNPLENPKNRSNRARDGSHLGFVHHKVFAHQIMEMIRDE